MPIRITQNSIVTVAHLNGGVHFMLEKLMFDDDGCAVRKIEPLAHLTGGRWDIANDRLFQYLRCEHAKEMREAIFCSKSKDFIPPLILN